MRVFSLNKNFADVDYIREVWECIQRNVRYFKKFNGAEYEEAMHLVLVRASNNRKEEYSDIEPYIKKLARTELRQRKHDISYTVNDEETGEIAKPFLQLTDTFDVYKNEQTENLMNVLTDMYLIKPDVVMALKPLLLEAKITEKEAKKRSAKIDENVRCIINSALNRMNGRDAYSTIAAFYSNLVKNEGKQATLTKIKTLNLTQGDYRCVSRLPDEETIRIVSGKNAGRTYGIQSRNGITMTEDINVDTVNWAPIAKGKCDVIKIDISPLIDYLYNNVYVDEGVQTGVRRWLGGRYVLTTPGGQEHLNMEEEQFITLCHEELLLNFIAGGINNIIAFSMDSVFVRPIRKIDYDTIRCKLFNDKTIDLKVSYFKEK